MSPIRLKRAAIVVFVTVMVTSSPMVAAAGPVGGDEVRQGVDAETVAASGVDGASGSATGSARTADAPAAGQLPLVTGHTVTVVENGEQRAYRVDDSETIRQVDTPQGTLVYPENVDFDVFSPRLFNADYLAEHGYGDATSVPVIVTLDDEQVSAADEGRAWAAEVGLQHPRSLDAANAVAGRIDHSEAATVSERLQQSDAVEGVFLDAGNVSDVPEGSAPAQASEPASTVQESDEPVVAIIDTGVDETHPDLGADRQVAERSFLGGDSETVDVDGHGTHHAALAVGTGEASDGAHAGVAPDANYMDLRVARTAKGGQLSNVVAAIEFAAENGADVISVGITVSATPEQLRTVVQPAIENAADQGSLVVASAGGTPAEAGRNGPYELNSIAAAPGTAPDAFTVGASNPVQSDIAPFSARGPTPGGHVKPDVIAPGTYVTSAASSSRAGSEDIESDYTTKLGSTIAVGTASGAAARLLADEPDLGVEEVKGRLASSANLRADRSAYEQGSGHLNVSRAANTSLFVTPATTDFGSHATDRTVERTVTVHNTGDEERTVSLDASATEMIDGGSGDVSLDESSVTVPAGETRTVTLTVETGSEAGLFSGRLTATPEDGEATTTSFGYSRTHEVTVRKETPDGQTTSGDIVLTRLHKAGVDRLITEEYSGESITYRSLGGETTIGSLGIDESTGEVVLTAETVTVDGNETVVLDETETVSYEVDASAVEDEGGPQIALYTEALIQRQVEDDGESTVFEIRGLKGQQRGARFSPGDEFNAKVATLMVPQSSVADGSELFDTPQAHFLHYATEGVDGPETFEADTDELARVNITYYRTSPDDSYFVTPHAQTQSPWQQQSSLQQPLSIGDRVHQTVYVTPGTAAYGFGAVSNQTQPEWANRFAPEVLEPNEERIVTINPHPTSGRNFQWNIENGRFTAKLPVMKALDHEVHRMITTTPNSFAIDIGDRPPKIFDMKGPGATIAAPLPINEGQSVTLYSVGRNNVHDMSTKTTTLFHATNRADGDSRPPAIDTYWVDGLSVYNTVPAGEVTVRAHVVDDSDVQVYAAIGTFDLNTVSPGEPKETVQRAIENDDAEGLLDAFVSGDVTRANVEQTEPGRYAVTADLSDASEGDRFDLRLLAVSENGDVMMTTTKNAIEIGDGPKGPSEGPYRLDDPMPKPTDAGTPSDGDTSSDDSASGSTDQPVPGFGAGMALIALAAAALLAARRRR